jgi:hypothetical protein
MSFGFSPSDIVLFIGFATKVVKALKQKGGSKSEYQLAERQCQDFLAVMEDIKHLDLSNIPEPFRSKIEEYATHTREFVTAFKQMINVYNKSMGKTSQSCPSRLTFARAFSRALCCREADRSGRSRNIVLSRLRPFFIEECNCGDLDRCFFTV